MFALVSYPTFFQKKFQDAYENWGVEREKRIIFLKLKIKDDNVFYTDIYIYIYIYIFIVIIIYDNNKNIVIKKKFKKMSTPF